MPLFPYTFQDISIDLLTNLNSNKIRRSEKVLVACVMLGFFVFYCKVSVLN